MKTLFPRQLFLVAALIGAWLALAGVVQAASMAIDSLTGPVTQNEINSFKTYMATQVPDPTPWGALNGTGHNAWADGNSGNALEAFGLMYEVSGDISILNSMIHWTDICVSERNDLMAATNGGQRVMWTGNIDKVWVPNDPTSASAGYAGGENGDTKAHIAYCALLILQNPSLWNTVVPDGNPFGYGTTYFQRATNYIAKCDEGNLEYDLPYFVTANNLIRNPANWPSGYHTMEANNIQMMLDGSWERLAQCHEMLGDNPSLVARYDAAVNGSANECLAGMQHAYQAGGVTVYKWYYYPYNTANIENVGHAAYDMVGMYRGFVRALNGKPNPYGFPKAGMVPFANALVGVMDVATNTFSGNVDGTGTTQNYMQAQWLLLADWNSAVYDVVAAADLASSRYKTTTLMDATMLWTKNRRYLQFSVAPTPASQTVQAGMATSFTVTVAPWAGLSNTVNLSVSGLPAGATSSFSPASVNLASLATASTNSTLGITTSTSTPPGAYALSVVGTAGSVSHTNTVTVAIGSFSVLATPASQSISPGGGTSFTISLTTNTSFSGSVSFGVSGFPANASGTFNPVSLSTNGNSTLTIATTIGAPPGSYLLNITGTNGSVVASTAVTLTINSSGNGVWTGGSLAGGNWSDAANWDGTALMPNNALVFNGSVRLNNTNDTAAGTTYSNILFNIDAGPFVLNGNPITLGGNITNNSANPQTLDLGLSINGSLVFNGGGNGLVVGGGLTNKFGAPGSTSLTLAGVGILSNLLSSTTSPGGTNVLLLNSSSASWTLMDNPASTAMAVPWVFEVNNGIFNFGAATSAPTLTSTTVNGAPSDNQVGTVSGAVGTFNMINGTLTTSARFNTATASSSTGIVNQVGGTLNIGSQLQGANGANPGEVSIVNVSGGTMNLGSAANPTSPFYVASRGTGTLTVSGLGVVSCGKLDISRNANGNSVASVGIVNLNGGSLMVTSVTNLSANQQTNGSPTATFNFNGGTLVAKPGSAAGFFQGSAVAPVTPITTIVKSGGAIIDDGGNAITLFEPLQHDSILGSIPDGGLTKLNSGTLTLTARSTYNGNTLVNGGTLALSGAGSISNSAVLSVAADATLNASGRSDGTLRLAAGQTLTGSGTVQGNVIAGSGATVAPGGALSTLTFNNNLTLNGGSTTVMEVSPGSAGPVTNDSAQVLGGLVYGGTLVITNVSAGSFSTADSFKLFSASGYSGLFTNIVPAIPAVNLAWNTNGLANGILSIVSSPTPPPTIGAIGLNGGNFVFSATNGVPGWPCCVLVSTNIASPLSQWQPLVTNVFSTGGTYTFSNAVDSTLPQYFYRLRLQ